MPINKYSLCIDKQANYFPNVLLKICDVHLYPMIADAVLLSVSTQQKRKQTTEIALAPYPKG